MRNWEIKARSRFCSGCERPFDIGQTYHCLLELSGDVPERKDFCVRCWREKDLSSQKEGPLKAYWKGTFKRLYTPIEREDIKKDVVLNLLNKYLESEKPPHLNLCYILALLEERKKTFLPRRVTRNEEGEKIIIYEHLETGDTYLIRDPGLTLKEAGQVQVQVKELIEREKEGGEKEGEEARDESRQGD